MRRIFYTPNRKGYFLFALITLMIISFFIEPAIKNHLKSNWDEILKTKTNSIEENIRYKVSEIESQLKSVINNVKDLDLSSSNSIISLELYNGTNKLVKWKNQKIHDDSLSNKFAYGLFSSSDERIVYLSYADSIIVGDSLYKIIYSCREKIPIQKHLL